MVYGVKAVVGIQVTIDCFDTGDQVIMFLCNSSKQNHFCYSIVIIVPVVVNVITVFIIILIIVIALVIVGMTAVFV